MKQIEILEMKNTDRSIDIQFKQWKEKRRKEIIQT